MLCFIIFIVLIYFNCLLFNVFAQLNYSPLSSQSSSYLSRSSQLGELAGQDALQDVIGDVTSAIGTAVTQNPLAQLLRGNMNLLGNTLGLDRPYNNLPQYSSRYGDNNILRRNYNDYERNFDFYGSNRFNSNPLLPSWPSLQQNNLLMNQQHMFPFSPNLRKHNNHHQICCESCPEGHVMCLSTCNPSCLSGKQCNSAGSGAYAAFCEKACEGSAASGFGLLSQPPKTYLPMKACEGECVAQVQDLCHKQMCREYGCIRDDCSHRASRYCSTAPYHY